MIQKAITILQSRGLTGLFGAVKRRIQSSFAGKSIAFKQHQNLFHGKNGIEIGGPSSVFSKRGIFPVYPVLGNLDNSNFSSDTVWGGATPCGSTFHFDSGKTPGRQCICKATSMGNIASASYDFVLSSHILEHCANPIQALSEWRRLLRDNGLLVLVLPDKRFTFDHRRPVTSLEHLIADFDSKMKENDLSHIREILELHDLERDLEAGDFDSFRSRSLRNYSNRCLHHHVFDISLAKNIIEYTGFNILTSEVLHPNHILTVAMKSNIQRFQLSKPCM